MDDQHMTTADQAEALMERRKSLGVTWAAFIDRLTVEASDAAAHLALARRLQSAIEGAGGQLPLIPDDIREPTKRRAARRVMMHEDAGRWHCQRCHETTEIKEGLSAVALKRGIPCPACNPTEVQP